MITHVQNDFKEMKDSQDELDLVLIEFFTNHKSWQEAVKTISKVNGLLADHNTFLTKEFISLKKEVDLLKTEVASLVTEKKAREHLATLGVQKRAPTPTTPLLCIHCGYGHKSKDCNLTLERWDRQ